MHGFNHKIKELLDTIIDRMVNIKVLPQQFEIIKEKVIKLILILIYKIFFIRLNDHYKIFVEMFLIKWHIMVLLI